MSKKKMDVNRKYSIKKLSLGVASVSVGLVVANAVDLDTMIIGKNPGENKSVAHAAVGDVLYTNVKPTDKVDAQGTNNDAISKIVEMESEVEGQKKIRVYFGDNLNLTKKISFETYGDILNGTDSAKIKFNNEEVGSLSVFSNRYDSRLEDFKSFNSFNEYFNYVKQDNNPTSKSKIEITLNDNFKKYNKNRYIEFEVKTSHNSASLQYERRTDDVTKLENYKKPIKNYFVLPNGDKVRLQDTYYVFNLGKAEASEEADIGKLRLQSYYTSTKEGLPDYLKEAKGIYNDLTMTTTDVYKVTKDSEIGKTIIEKGTKIENILNDQNIYKIKDSLKVGDIVEFPISYIKKSGGHYEEIWKGDVFRKRHNNPSNERLKENVKVKVIEKTDTKIVYEVQDNIIQKSNYEFLLKTNDFEIREDFINRVGKDKYLRFLSSKEHTLDTLGTNTILAKDKNNNLLFQSYTIKSSLVKKIGNLGYGESTTGSVQVKYVDENNKEIRKSELVAHNQPWHKDINITPPSIEGYAYVSSSSPLKDIVGGEDRTIVLKYKNIEVKQTRELPFNVIYKEDKSLERGKTVVESQGEKGIEEYKTLVGKEVANSKKITKQPVNRVVKIGAKDKVETEKIPFTTRYEADNTKEKGTQTVVSPGREGVKTTITTFSVDSQSGAIKENKGKPTLKLPEERVVKVGSKDKVVTEKLPFTTRYEADNTKEKGTQTVVSPGKEGTKTTVTKYTVNSTTGAVSEIVQKPTVVASQDKVIKVGTKDKVATEKIPFTTRYEADNTKEKGTQTVVTTGKEGTKTTVTKYTVNPTTGAVTESVQKPTVVASQDKVIKVGTKDKVDPKLIPSVKKYVKDDTREYGQPNITINGNPGVEKITTKYTVNPTTGAITESKGKPEITQPTDTVIKVAAKTKVEIKKTLPKIEIRENKQMVKGKEKIVQQGKPRVLKETTEYVVNPKTGEITQTKKTDVVEAGQPTIKEVGTRNPKDIYKDKVTEVVIPHNNLKDYTTANEDSAEITPEGDKEYKLTKIETEYQGDPTLEKGEQVEVSDGKKDGKRIVKVGTKPVITKSNIPFIEKKEFSDKLAKGQEKVKQEGKVGTRTTTVSYIVNPKTGEITEKSEVKIDKPIDKIIETGTKITTIYKGNPTLTYGENKVISDGEKDGNRVIEIGVKEKIEVKETPSPIRYVKDPTRDKGEKNEVILGKTGKETTITKYTVNEKTGEITEVKGTPIKEDAVETVIKVPAKDKVETINQKDGKIIKRTTTYEVDSKTGKITETVKEELIADKGSNPPVAEEKEELKVGILKDEAGEVIDVIKADEKPQEKVKGYVYTGKSEKDKDNNVIHQYKKETPKVEAPKTEEKALPKLEEKKETPKEEKALPKIETPSENTPVVQKKQELPKTSSESNTATAVGLGIVGLGAAMTLRKRKQHR